MPRNADQHECDLFLMSSHHAYRADRALPEFARRGSRNIHGWGLGWYVNDHARVLRQETPATEHGTISREFAIAVDATSSPVLLGHLRLASRGARRRENNHPFRLSFLGYDWLLIHNGTAHRHDLVTHDQRLLVESDNDTARVFEFLRLRIIEYHTGNPKRSLIEACRKAFAALLHKDPGGGFNIILSNGHLSFALVHHREFYLLHREKDPADAVLLSTLKLTEDEDWLSFERLPSKKAKMLVFNGPTLILNGDI